MKTFQTRIKNKIDNIDAFNANTPLVPLKGEIVIGANNVGSNTNADPYILKIGDGTHSWNGLPAIGPNIFTGVAATATNEGGDFDSDMIVTMNIGADTKTYGKYSFGSTGDTTFEVNITGGDYMLTEHYLLLDNSEGSIDRYFNGISIANVNSSNIFVQCDYVTAGDIVELKLSFYSISGTTYATVTSKAGLTNGGKF